MKILCEKIKLKFIDRKTSCHAVIGHIFFYWETKGFADFLNILTLLIIK